MPPGAPFSARPDTVQFAPIPGWVAQSGGPEPTKMFPRRSRPILAPFHPPTMIQRGQRWNLTPSNCAHPSPTPNSKQPNPTSRRNRSSDKPIHAPLDPNHPTPSHLPPQRIGNHLRRSTPNIETTLTQNQYHPGDRHRAPLTKLIDQHEPKPPASQRHHANHPDSDCTSLQLLAIAAFPAMSELGGVGLGLLMVGRETHTSNTSSTL